MKKLALLIIVGFVTYCCQAQDNPYKIFGYKTKVEYKTSQVDIYRVDNKKGNSPIKYLIFDRENKTIRLLNDSDKLVSTIVITDDQLLRWTVIDPYAKKYPSMSPYNYGANNPITNIDVHGDSIRTTGSAAANQSMRQTAEAGMGGVVTMTQATNGNWTMSKPTDDQIMSTMTVAQVDMYNKMNSMISNTNTASFNLVEGNSNILVGDNGTATGITATPGVHTIDVQDVRNIGETGALTGHGALMHELSEGYAIQVNHATPGAAHFNTAIPTEGAVNGVQINLTPASPPTIGGTGTTQTIGIPVTIGGVRKTVTLNFTNGNIPATGGVTNNTRW